MGYQDLEERSEQINPTRFVIILTSYKDGCQDDVLSF